MSRVSRALVLSCAIPLVAPAVAAGQTIHGGVKGGIVFSNLSNLRDAIELPDGVDIDMRTGSLLGGFVTFDVNEWFAVQPEVLFTTKGATPSDGENELRIDLDYIDVPVLARFTPIANNPFYLLAGPSLNFNVRAKATEDFEDSSEDEEEEDIKDDIEGTEFGLVFGAGVSIRNFLVEGRYIAGLTNIAKGEDIDESVRNRAFAILVGFRF